MSQCDDCDLSQLFTRDLKSTSIFDVAIRRVWDNVESVILFLVLDLINFMEENVVSQRYVLPNIEHIFSAHFLRHG